jgi:hypothetical protein
MAAQAHPVCGTHMSRWEARSNLVDFITTNSDTTYLGGLEAPAHSIAKIRNSMQNKSGLKKPEDPMLTLLAMTQSFRCQDPRDRVFYLIGLLSTPKAPGLTIGYSLSPKEIY